MADISLIFVLFKFEAKLNQKQGNRFFVFNRQIDYSSVTHAQHKWNDLKPVKLEI